MTWPDKNIIFNIESLLMKGRQCIVAGRKGSGNIIFGIWTDGQGSFWELFTSGFTTEIQSVELDIPCAVFQISEIKLCSPWMQYICTYSLEWKNPY